jgi:hypothetical protein
MTAADVGRRGTKSRLERTIEIRNVGKSRRRCDVADLAPGLHGLAEHSVRQQQALLEHEPCEECSGLLEEMLHIARAQPMARCHSTEPRIRLTEPAEDIRLDGIEPRRRETTDCTPVQKERLQSAAVDDGARVHLNMCVRPRRHLRCVRFFARNYGGENVAKELAFRTGDSCCNGVGVCRGTEGDPQGASARRQRPTALRFALDRLLRRPHARLRDRPLRGLLPRLHSSSTHLLGDSTTYASRTGHRAM